MTRTPNLDGLGGSDPTEAGAMHLRLVVTQGFEIGCDSIQLLIRKLHRGHQRAALERVRLNCALGQISMHEVYCH